jgi:two-component system sensor histidine kinase AtoS
MDDKQQYLKALEEIIENSYKVENTFNIMRSIFEDIIEFLPDPLWVFNEDGTVFIQNSEASKITELITKIDSTKESSEIEFESRTYLIKSKHSQKNLIISATDITEQKRVDRLRSMGQISAHLSHEIRNPIGAISLLTSTLLKRAKDDTKPIIQEIQNSIFRVERIIKSTLLFSKGIQVKKRAIHLDKFHQMLEDSFNHYTKDKDINLTIEFEDTTIEVDEDLLTIVFQNFLFNAIDAIEEDDEDDGVINFSYKDGAIIVKDSGQPIVDEDILYKPFETTKLKGTGLGLALSLEIIKAHDGKIELLEDEKGFKISL